MAEDPSGESHPAPKLEQVGLPDIDQFCGVGRKP